MLNVSKLLVACFGVSLISSASIPLACAQYRDAIGYTRLVEELNGRGIPIPTGAGLRVGLVEASTNGLDYYPNTGSPEFAGKSFNNLGPATNPSQSSHATTVARNFIGNTWSIAPGVSQVDVYDASFFLYNQQGLLAGSQPLPTNVAVMNHSFIANLTPTSAGVEANARMDHTINRDAFTNVVALNNGNGAVPQIYGQSYNSIVVGLTDGTHSYGVTTIGVTGRTKPDIVAPDGATSFGTPMVSSTATFLHSAADSLGLVNARRPEAMKAILMAGADKSPIAGWSNTSTRPLDSIFGAGEVDVYNSYKILEGGEFNGSSGFPATNSGLFGWDLGEVQANSNQFWTFEVAPGGSITEASILLTWNSKYQDANGDFDVSEFTIANMGMRLYEATGAGIGSLVAFSDSPVDNVEHLYLKNLSSGRYALEISSDIATRFGLAWRITAVPEPGTLWLVSIVAVAGGFWRRRSR